MPSTLSMPSRVDLWPSSLPRLALWWAHQQQPAQPAQPAPQPAQPAPTDQPAAEPAPAPAEPAAAPADQPPSDAEVIAEAQAALEGSPQEGSSEVIVVTGSAIERSETTTPAPVTVLDRELLQASGMVSIGDVLQDLPSQSNAINTQANNGGDGSTRVNIRGLGARRTLVLMNGRRIVPGGTGADASVDLNSIPLAVIERIEVLKDGASAVYGSDAIGGVVNIITRTDFQGVEANLYTATTQGGGGTTYDASFVAGLNSPKGNVVFSAGLYDQSSVFAYERGFASPQRELDFASGEEQNLGSSATPEGTILDFLCEGDGITADQELAQMHETGCRPRQRNKDGSIRLVDGDGNACTTGDDCRPVPQPFQGCTSSSCFRDQTTGQWRNLNRAGTSDSGTGDLYNYQPENYLLTPQRRYNVFSAGHYKFHDNVRGFFEAMYVNRNSEQQLAPEPLTTGPEGLLIAENNVYNNLGRPIPDIRKRMVETGDRVTTQDIDTFRVVGGIDGAIPDQLLEGWKYEASYNFGRTIALQTNAGNLILPNVAAALGPSFTDADGSKKCGQPGAVIDGCVPMDVFGGIGSITQEMVDYVTYTGVRRGYNRQHTALGSLHGPLFKTPWNGDVVLALGGDYRYEAGGDLPDPMTASGNTTGNKADPTGGHYDVIEGFAELSVVPVTNMEWAKWLELSGAVRAVDYSTFGSNVSWKTGVLYKLPFGLGVRGTYSTAFRAPNINELYGGTTDDFPQVTDPCDTSKGSLDPLKRRNCDAQGVPRTFEDANTQFLARAGGNPELDPEKANILTLGTVYEPTFAEGLALTLDYFNVGIDNSIQPADVGVYLSNCYASENPTNCDKIQRSPITHRITTMDERTINIGRVETSGLDVSLQYTYEFRGIGRFRHNLEGTRLFKYNEFLPDGLGGEVGHAGLGVYDLGVYPKYRANFATQWSMGGAGAGFNVRYIHSFKECRDPDDTVRDDCTLPNAIEHDVDANVTADVMASYSFSSPVGRSSIAAGVNNVLDQTPPNVYNGFLATSDSNTYDYLGRFFYLRLSQLF